jgi:glycosyltransferase involved in cell wall biosynthesis
MNVNTLTAKDRQDVRVLIAAEHATTRFGGEAILPLHIFRGLRRSGIEAWLVVHARTRDELEAMLPDELDRIHFIPDTLVDYLLFRVGQWLPDRVGYFTSGLLGRLLTQWKARRIVRRLVAEHRIDVVHQPIPVSPREPSIIDDVGAPVLMGPLNGGMSYPPAFRGRQNLHVTRFLHLAHLVTNLMNRLMPGKLHAAVVLVANERTRRALPSRLRGEVLTLVENGVDLSIWWPAEGARAERGPIRVVFVGRLIDCKAVDLLLEAFRDVITRVPATLQLAGDGPQRRRWEAKARALGLEEVVQFLGWYAQEECAELLRRSDVLVLPSLHECGGAVVLEAMATGLPVVATNWGGPPDYLDESCGILVDPTSESSFVAGLADAITILATSPDLRSKMGHAGRERAVRDFDWDKKIESLLDIYGQLTRSDSGCPRTSRHDPPPGPSFILNRGG